MPTEEEILGDMKENSNEITFVGAGSIYQNIQETLFIRKIKFGSEEVLKKIIYKKEGMNWNLKAVEDILDI